MSVQNKYIQTEEKQRTAGGVTPLRKSRRIPKEISPAVNEVDFWKVDVSGLFWSPRLQANQAYAVKSILRCLEKRIRNFSAVSTNQSIPHQGIFYDDSDVYKALEGIAYCLQGQRDKELESTVDSIIDTIASSQWEDGYINTYYSLPEKRKAQRWTDLKDKHELYCAGHLIEAGIAYFNATGKTKLLDTAVKFADCIDSYFGPNKIQDVDGHQEIELSLIKLYKVTKKHKYLNLAKFFLDQRGNNHSRTIYGEYHQDHKPVVEQEEAVGHAVRAGYMYAAMTEIVAQTNDLKYKVALNKLWGDVVSSKMYITGGTGSRHDIEGYGLPYELPNKDAYSETCASIANVFWNQRMFLIHHDAKYIDIIERILYNAFLSGISLGGDEFFYVNPLEHDGNYPFNISTTNRQPWYSCSCCPTNVVRFVPTISKYIYGLSKNSVYVNLFIPCQTVLQIAEQSVQLQLRTNYPWDGRIQLIVKPELTEKFQIKLRIPGWAQGKPVPSDLYQYLAPRKNPIPLSVNGQNIGYEMENGYAIIERTWVHGDVVEMNLPMPVNQVICHEMVENNQGKIALERGPLVYCVEWPDNKQDIDDIQLAPDTHFITESHPDLLNGIVTISGNNSENNEKFTAIPYYAWSHRGTGKMKVWLPSEQA